MKNRVKNLLNSLISQYEQLIDCKFNGDTADVVNKNDKLYHHLAKLEYSIKHLINMGTPIFTFSGGIECNINEDFEIIPNEDEIDGIDNYRAGIDNYRDRVAFIKIVKAFVACRFELRFDNFVSEHSDSVNNYYKLVESIENKNVDFKHRTVLLLMCCSDY